MSKHFSQNVTLHDKREMNKIGLEHFFLDKINMYDYAVDKLIQDKKDEIVKLEKQHQDWVELEETNPERYKELEEQAERYEINILRQRHEYFIDISYVQEELITLVEMKIIYAFKFLEVNIKTLIKAVFSIKSTKEFYRWHVLEKYLNGQNIDIQNLKGYKEISQLRTVNNSLKHSEELDVKLNSIEEFKKSTNLTYESLESFYSRIKESPNVFLQNLISAIYDELYVFNTQKIASMSESLVLRMDEKDASLLINKIKKHYE